MNRDIVEVVMVEGQPYRKAQDGALHPMTNQTNWATADKYQPLPSDDDAPMSDEDWARTELRDPFKKPVTIRLDADIIDWFKAQGPRYQTRINSALRLYVDAQGRRKNQG
jgi:uncharacterized protein (DUF4415 family)